MRVTLPLSVFLLQIGCATVPELEPCEPETFSYTRSAARELNLLVVVDNSGSMLDEQAALADALPRLVRALTTGDHDGDGDVFGDGELDDPDFEPLSAVHVGVVTADMGVGGQVVPTCERAAFGDNGVLRTSGDVGSPGCMATYPGFLAYRPGGDLASSSVDLGCVLRAGTDGCGFEQPLEAALKALSPSAPTVWTGEGYEPPVFFRDTFGHGDTSNDGFVTERSILAIMVLANENDCSARDPELFDPSGRYRESDLNFRCIAHQDEALQPIERYVEGFLQLRRDPRELIFLPIVGIPLGLDTTDAGTDWDEILDHDDMVERANPENPAFQDNACENGADRFGKPGRRFVRLARELESRGVPVGLSSICNRDYDGAIDLLIQGVRAAVNGPSCIRAIAVESDLSVRCDVDRVLFDGGHCSEIPGASPLLSEGEPVLESGRPVCRLTQLTPSSRSPGSSPPEGAGWYYDDFSAGCTESTGDWGQIAVNPEGRWGPIRLSCHPSAVVTRCRTDDDCHVYGLPGANCVEGECVGWTCE